MRRKFIKFVFVICFLFCNNHVNSQSTDFTGQLSTWANFSDQAWSQTQLGLRYIPSVSFEKYISEEDKISTDIALNLTISGFPDSLESFRKYSEMKAYRIWLRYASAQYEVRAGLQKINFGSAALIRPLMWFERMDPRDPLRLARGVYGILFRYYFLDNTNIWCWGLFGNSGTKGWEIQPTSDRSPEYGARIQTPFLNGELAISYHHRDVSSMQNSESDTKFAENRIAVDGKWDYEVGFWFETVYMNQRWSENSLNHTHNLNIGIDYTFPIGNGIHLLSEYFISTKSAQFMDSGPTMKMFAVLADYSLGLLDYLMTIFFYDLVNQNLYRYISWQRMYDNWSFYFNVYWNPEFNVLGNINELSALRATSGLGLQIMVVFNH
jgi:hypothetical protein